MSVTLDGNLFSLEALAKNQTFRITQDSQFSEALRVIKIMAKDKFAPCFPTATHQMLKDVAQKEYSITPLNQKHNLGGQFLITMNGSPIFRRVYFIPNHTSHVLTDQDLTPLIPITDNDVIAIGKIQKKLLKKISLGGTVCQ